MKMKNIPSVKTSHFTYDKDRRSFFTFVSDIQHLMPGPVRIYDDACDVGFYLESDKTGAKILFVEESVNRADGEIRSWMYTAHCPKENPQQVLDLKLTIFND